MSDDNIHKTEQDWEQLVPEGKVYGEQLNSYVLQGRLGILVRAYATLFVSIFMFFALPGVLMVMMEKASTTVLPDPQHYTSIPGLDGTYSYKYAQLAQKLDTAYQGLNHDQFIVLEQALRSDIDKYGMDYAKWELVASVQPQPTITIPEKAFEPNIVQQMSNGVLIVNKNNVAGVPPVTLLAWVDGRLEYVAFNQGMCEVMVGNPIADKNQECGSMFNLDPLAVMAKDTRKEDKKEEK
ncbi:hypothetical protein B0W47_16770 (plasmid) [Komagataeibacter nataicola]|uniref:Uncharacterized protein n=1 Tax=Komagataeibacter nataicola TaxID=265960 RepID=A0A9N7CCL0_9PROT|nr:hypothetical protein [Komagataeibacter nataicola]AQU89233.1 hypothetical protein B0W47_16770 [Komagataeibacter nataicola]PYD66309.1 hypothetical protein CDI09_09175 [Komagataeibacter nataicola]WNM10356.1 hypothetical protein RI056_18830 [Komagataeibacter nataicola]GBR23515.1 hypothetical protein AA0616_2541 [Komagataeibacter nataicola NRIC 0616]